MKINYKFFTALALTALMFTSCDEGDAVVDDVVDGTERGAILRTVNVTSNELPIGVADGFFGVELEIQDSENGGLVQAIDVYASFNDQTPNNGLTGNEDEVKLETVSTDGMVLGEFGLPRFEYQVTLPQLLSATGVSETVIDGGDQFRVRFELILSDGRTFSFAQNSGTLTGSYFSSPFLYSATIVCPPTPPAAGDWIFDMSDAYGDGWNGASLLVTLDGVEMNFLTDGANTIETLTVPAGAQVISIQYVSGAWDGEVGFTVTSANGNVILTQVAYSDANASAGVELINYCIMNY